MVRKKIKVNEFISIQYQKDPEKNETIVVKMETEGEIFLVCMCILYKIRFNPFFFFLFRSHYILSDIIISQTIWYMCVWRGDENKRKIITRTSLDHFVAKKKQKTIIFGHRMWRMKTILKFKYWNLFWFDFYFLH